MKISHRTGIAYLALALFLLVSASSSGKQDAAPARMTRVGIIGFDMTIGLESDMGNRLYEMLLEAVDQSGRREVTARAQIDRTRERISQSEPDIPLLEVEQMTISELGIQRIYAGSLTKLDKKYYIIVKVLSPDLTVERIVRRTAGTGEDLQAIVDNIAAELTLPAEVFRRMQEEKQAWKTACAEDTEDAYRLFLKNFPESQHAGEADRRAKERKLPFNMEMASIKGGVFFMASTRSEEDRDPDESPIHQVRLSAFRLGKYEVTFAQYDSFCEATGREKSDDAGWGRGNRPVIGVSWHDAVAFCQWLSEISKEQYRLPTEAEWEYACRAGRRGRFSWGMRGENAHEHANLADENAKLKHPDWATTPVDDGYAETAPVGSYKPNRWGLYDMHGNVWEWCADWYTPGYWDSPEENPKGPAGGSVRVVRGGAWFNELRYLRCASRHWFEPGHASTGVGFRVAMSE